MGCSMKKHKRLLVILSLVLIPILLSSVLVFFLWPKKPIEPISLGAPYSELDPVARVPWDLAIHDGYLYVGAGDYGRNISPGVAKRASLRDFVWQSCGEIEDEQINRFLWLGDSFVIPATDPKGPWDLGGYYTLVDGAFSKHYTIPHAVHTFDMVEYKGMLFAAIGVDDDRIPVVCSKDNGATFVTVPLRKTQDDLPQIEGYLRIYDFFLFEGELYLLYADGLFRYTEQDGGYFRFVDTWSGQYETVKETYVPILTKAEFNGRFFFTTEKLYVCESVEGVLGKPAAVGLDCDAVMDILVYRDTLYLLTYERHLSSYTVSLKESKDGKSFSEVLSFDYDIPAMSFATDGKVFYFGMGKINAVHEKNGTILKVFR